jgi:FKBP-type peptidyl-prolyl cis-trans isomerase
MTEREKLTRIQYPFVYLFILVSAIVSCNNNEPAKEQPNPSELKESLIYANKEAVVTEAEQIHDFLRRYNWPMSETGSGLRYWIYEDGHGEMVQEGDLIEIQYVVSLLNGDTVYTSVEKGPLVFVPGRAQVISGLEEGILLLKQGDRAKFIIPSHLAFGLIGDQDRIGGKTTLVYDVKVLRIKKEQL